MVIGNEQVIKKHKNVKPGKRVMCQQYLNYNHVNVLVIWIVSNQSYTHYLYAAQMPIELVHIRLLKTLISASEGIGYWCVSDIFALLAIILLVYCTFISFEDKISVRLSIILFNIQYCLTQIKLDVLTLDLITVLLLLWMLFTASVMGNIQDNPAITICLCILLDVVISVFVFFFGLYHLWLTYCRL